MKKHYELSKSTTAKGGIDDQNIKKTKAVNLKIVASGLRPEPHINQLK
jgi:hypothetical protein